MSKTAREQTADPTDENSPDNPPAVRSMDSRFVGMRQQCETPIRMPPTLTRRQAMEILTNGHCAD